MTELNIERKLSYGTYTSLFLRTEEEANRAAKAMCIERDRYYGTIKGKPHIPEHPERCWAITNRWSRNLK